MSPFPVGPCIPVGPVTPCTPVAPVFDAVPGIPIGPVIPVSPVLPAIPVSPVIPVAPVFVAKPSGPRGPVYPVVPVGPASPVNPKGTKVVRMKDALQLSKYSDKAALGTEEYALNLNKMRVFVSHRQTGLEIYNGITSSVAVVKDALVTVTLSEAANGFGVKVPFSSWKYNVHWRETTSGWAVLTHTCISHIPGGIILDDNRPGINAN